MFCSFFVSWYKEIPFDATLSESSKNKVNSIVDMREHAEYNDCVSYHIRYDENKNVVLVPNFKRLNVNAPKPEEKIAKTETCIFVIILNNDNTLELRIRGGGSHFFLAQKKDSVIAAGTIKFQDSKIIEITDLSGGYHINYDAVMSPVQKRRIRYSFIKALKAVGLPTTTFVPITKLSEGSDLSGSSHIKENKSPAIMARR